MCCTSRRLCAVSVFILLTQAINAAAQISFTSLLQEMVDLEALSRFPSPAYVTRVASSYDRRSTDPNVQTDENWFANDDYMQFVRTEENAQGEKEYVLMETEGPGAVVHIWSSDPYKAGYIRFYFDYEKTPEINVPMKHLLGGEYEYAPPPLAHVVAGGWNLYLPIPFSTHCKITTTENNFHYRIDYRLYEKGTPVKTFTRADAYAHTEDVLSIAQRLSDPLHLLEPFRETFNAQEFKGTVPGAMSSATLFSQAASGPAAVREVLLRIHSEDIKKASRACMLRITCDDAQEPQVEVPVGDFFGTPIGIHPYQSLLSGVMEDGLMYARWVMPFQRVIKIELQNYGDEPVDFEGAVSTAPYDWGPQSLYFHAHLRLRLNYPTQPRSDWNVAQLEGRGRYVGLGLQVSNPTPTWWGEGDEKIYVDNETFPSIFGTSVYALFGYGPGVTETFAHAYHNQPMAGAPGNFGHTYNNRFFVMDSIPFTQRLRFDLEVWHFEYTAVSFAATSFYYADADTRHDFRIPHPLDLREPEIPHIERVEGALEGENLHADKISGGTFKIEMNFAMPWSHAAQLLWEDATPGAQAIVYLPLEIGGLFEVFARFTKRADGGRFTLDLNGEPALEDVDLYSPTLKVTEEISLGRHVLKKGLNVLRIEVKDKNPAAGDKNRFGLDYLRIEPRD